MPTVCVAAPGDAATGSRPDGRRSGVKVALITRRYPPLIGGAEKLAGYLARALADEGADVTVLTAMPPGYAEAVGPSGGPKGAGRLAVVRLPTSKHRYVGTWLYMRSLRRWLEAHPIDLAYVSMLKHDAYVAVGVGRSRGFPVVLRPEGAGATGDLAWQAWGRFGRRIGARCKQADAVVSISPAVTAELCRAGYDPARVHAIPNGVPVPAAAWEPRPVGRDAPRAVSLGRLAPEKGLDTLVDAWPAVLARHPRARLTLVGEGPERPALEARVAARGLAGAVELPGATDDPTATLREADLFVHPSREEGMSVALLEAMALGVPVVASAIPGNLRVVTDREHGRLAPPDDPGALAAAVLGQWADPGLALVMARAARRRVRDEFSVQAVARTHLALFAQLVGARRPPSGPPNPSPRPPC